MIRGNIHEYLGMPLDYTVLVQVRISTTIYIEDILDAFYKVEKTGEITKSSTTPNNIFMVNEDFKELSQNKVLEF